MLAKIPSFISKPFAGFVIVFLAVALAQCQVRRQLPKPLVDQLRTEALGRRGRQHPLWPYAGLYHLPPGVEDAE